jgi:hypothetical protein
VKELLIITCAFTPSGSQSRKGACALYFPPKASQLVVRPIINAFAHVGLFFQPSPLDPRIKPSAAPIPLSNIWLRRARTKLM